ncbi:hypothetical protein JCM9279_005539 [Rhodotorula babjevae]
MASANPSTDDFSDYYLDPPTEEQLDELEARRVRALQHPLTLGDSLSWQAPNLHPESLPPADYPRETPLVSPHEPRPLLATLLARDSPNGGGPSWSLRLLEGLQTGADKWSQVWRGEAVDEQGRTVGRVVLKLYYQALFPFPDRDLHPNVEHDVFYWWPAHHAESCESRAYRELSTYQGRDVPFCYGFYEFRLPNGDEVVGVVLEDLVDDVVPFSSLVQRPGSTQRGTYKQACAAVELHHRVTTSGLISTANHVEDLHRLKISWYCVVAIGFSHCEFLDRAHEIHRRNLERQRAQGPLEPWEEVSWALSNSESIIVSTVQGLLEAMGHDYQQWRQEKATQQRLSFLEEEL